MAYDKKNLDLTGSGSKGVGCIPIYRTTVDNKAAVKAVGYFNSSANEFTAALVPVILIVATDATFFAKLVVAAGVVTISLPDIYT